MKIYVTFALELVKNNHMSLSAIKNSDRLAGFLPAKDSGCHMHFME